MAEKSGKTPDMLSPLFSTGVGHAKVHSPVPGPFPDPLGYMNTTNHNAGWLRAGSGDDVNEWDAEREQPSS